MIPERFLIWINIFFHKLVEFSVQILYMGPQSIHIKWDNFNKTKQISTKLKGSGKFYCMPFTNGNGNQSELSNYNKVNYASVLWCY